MAVRFTESRWPSGYGPTDLGPGDASESGFTLVSDQTTPVAGYPVNYFVLWRRNDEPPDCQFIWTSDLCRVADTGHWDIPDFDLGLDPQAEGWYSRTPSVAGDLTVEVVVRRGDEQLARLSRKQSVVPYQPAVGLPTATARGATIQDPTTVNYVLLAHKNDITAAATRHSVPAELIAAFVYAACRQSTAAERQVDLDELAKWLNEGSRSHYPDVSINGLGVCGVKLHLAWCFFSGQPDLGAISREIGVSLEAYEYDLQKRMAAAVADSEGRAKARDLLNILRFSRSNIFFCAQMLSALKIRRWESAAWPYDPRDLKILADEFRNGPTVELPESPDTAYQDLVADTAVTSALAAGLAAPMVLGGKVTDKGSGIVIGNATIHVSQATVRVIAESVPCYSERDESRPATWIGEPIVLRRHQCFRLLQPEVEDGNRIWMLIDTTRGAAWVGTGREQRSVSSPFPATYQADAARTDANGCFWVLVRPDGLYMLHVVGSTDNIHLLNVNAQEAADAPAAHLCKCDKRNNFDLGNYRDEDVWASKDAEGAYEWGRWIIPPRMDIDCCLTSFTRVRRSSSESETETRAIRESEITRRLKCFEGFTYDLNDPRHPYSIGRAGVPLATQSTKLTNCSTFTSGLLLKAWESILESRGCFNCAYRSDVLNYYTWQIVLCTTLMSTGRLLYGDTRFNILTMLLDFGIVEKAYIIVPAGKSNQYCSGYGAGVQVLDDSTTYRPRPWTLVQSFPNDPDKSPKDLVSTPLPGVCSGGADPGWAVGGHSYLILDYYPPTDKVLVLEANTSERGSLGLNGVGYRYLGNLNGNCYKKPNDPVSERFVCHRKPITPWWDNGPSFKPHLETWEQIRVSGQWLGLAELKVFDLQWLASNVNVPD